MQKDQCLTPDTIDATLSKFIINLPEKQLKFDRLIYHTQLAFYYCYDNKLFIEKNQSLRQEYDKQKHYRKKFCLKVYNHSLSQQIIDRIQAQNQSSFWKTNRGLFIFNMIQDIKYPIYGIIIYRVIAKQQKDQLDTFTPQEKIMLKTRVPQKLKQFNQMLGTKLQFFMVQCKNTGRYGFPKGKIDEGEEPHKCAERQVLEQTGYQIFVKQDKYIQVDDFYIFFVLDNSTLKLVQEPQEDLEKDGLQLHNRKKRQYEIKPQNTGWYDLEKLRDKMTHRSKDAHDFFRMEQMTKKQDLKNQLQEQLEKIKEQKQKQWLEKKSQIRPEKKQAYKPKYSNSIEGRQRRPQGYRTKSKSISKYPQCKWKEKSPIKSANKTSQMKNCKKNPENEKPKQEKKSTKKQYVPKK